MQASQVKIMIPGKHTTEDRCVRATANSLTLPNDVGEHYNQNVNKYHHQRVWSPAGTTEMCKYHHDVCIWLWVTIAISAKEGSGGKGEKEREESGDSDKVNNNLYSAVPMF